MIELEIGETAPVGIGIPGTISPITGLVKNANSTWLIGRSLRRDLETAFGRPTRLANDANCFALSEATDGAAAGMETVFGVILGTGVGGGIALGGRILLGANAIAGEWGHNPLPSPAAGEIPGPRCYCGRSGCIETFLSGPALAADHHRHTGHRLSTLEIVDLAERGDGECGATLGRYTDRLARGLAAVINLIDPDAIVLGGGLSGISALYERVPLLWGEHVFCDAFYATVEKRDRPDLADRPLIIGGGSRGVVLACCYVTRLYGVRSAMPMFKALADCPDAVVNPAGHEQYREVGRAVPDPAGRDIVSYRLCFARRRSRRRHPVSADRRRGRRALVEGRVADPPTLFDRELDRPRRLERAMDQIRRPLGEGSVRLGRDQPPVAMSEHPMAPLPRPRGEPTW